MSNATPRHLRLGLAAVAAVVLAAAMLWVALLRPSTAASASGQTVRIKASPTALKFNVKTLHVRHGRVTIVMSNPRSGSLAHGVGVSGRGVRRVGRTVNPGSTSRVTVTLKKGRYTFFCPVPGHAAAGMKGTVVVS
jgi:uncharacterized cupredoxin-like copper-binding protein